MLNTTLSLDPDIQPAIGIYLQKAKRAGAQILYDPNIHHPEILKEASLKPLGRTGKNPDLFVLPIANILIFAPTTNRGA